MKYFIAAEKRSMLQESWEFDGKMIHEKCKVVEGLTNLPRQLKEAQRALCAVLDYLQNTNKKGR
jgi:hypothetical protein